MKPSPQKPSTPPIMNPPEGGGDTATLVAVLAPIIARLCAVEADVLELPPKKPRRLR